jgi:hypothetical protein
MPLSKPGQNFINETREAVMNYPLREVNESPKYYAVIVDTRPSKDLEYVCKNIWRFTTPEWGLQMFHNDENETFVKETLKDIPDVVFTNIKRPIKTMKDYSFLMTDPWFYEQIKTEKFLIFQTDSFILRPGIEEFLKWDYIGAPWPNRNKQTSVGNGGFSLRSKSRMLEICKLPRKDFTRHPEDLYYANNFQKIKGIQIADYETARKFSTEQIKGCDSFAFHAHFQNVTTPNLKQKYLQYFNVLI